MTSAALLRKGDEGAPPVVLVHGAWHGAWTWEGNYLDAFATAGFAALAPDLPGHGARYLGGSMLGFRIRDCVDDMAELIAGLDIPPVVIGHSMGGFVVQHLMARGVAMRGVGLLASVPPWGAAGAAFASVRQNPMGFLRTNLKLSLYPLVDDPDRAAHLFLGDDIGAAEGRAFAARLHDESYMAFLDMLALALPGRPARAYPVAVIGGRRDALFTPGGQERMAEKFGAGLCRLLDAPHNVMMSKAGPESAALFIDWARALPAGEAPDLA